MPVKSGVPQVFIIGSLFFLIYINDLSEDIKSTVILFVDETFLFSVIHNNNSLVSLPGTFRIIFRHEVKF